MKEFPVVSLELCDSKRQLEEDQLYYQVLYRRIIPFVTFVYNPQELSLLTLNHAERIKILNYYFDNLSQIELIFAQRVIRPLVRSLEKLITFIFLVKCESSL